MVNPAYGTGDSTRPYSNGGASKATSTSQAVADALGAKSQIDEIQKRIDGLIADKKGIEKQISDLNKDLSAATDPLVIESLTAQIKAKKIEKASFQTQIAALQTQVSEIKARGQKISGWETQVQKMIGSPLTNVKLKFDTKAISYNVSSVKDAYFNDSAGFMKKVVPSIQNTPKFVAEAANLWVGGVANKGMIQTWSPPSATAAYTQIESPTTLGKYSMLNKRYGFQFQYNPTYVDMAYSGVLAVDSMFEGSGMDKFNAIVGTTGSSIAFQVMINRVYDMPYYMSTINGGKLKPGVGNIYPVMPSVEDQKAIYSKGTMYDIEYLFRTILGYTMPSQLRNEDTADMGFLGAMPVELHLGNKLRYLVTIDSINVNHVLFNERMVPLFSTVDIRCFRLPDFAAFTQEFDTGKTTPTTNKPPQPFGTVSNPNGYDYIDYATGTERNPGGADGNPMTPN